MKKCFIGMSINKQLYFGILGTSFLFGFLCLLLVLLSSLKLFFHYKDNIIFVYNELDTNIVSLNAEIADIFAQLLIHQGNFEAYFIRNYYNTLSEEIGESLLNTINTEENEIDSHFIFSNNYEDENNPCQSNENKCYFVFGSQLGSKIKKKLFILKPTIDISLDIYAFNKEDLKIFNKFNFYDKENEAYISYQYSKTDISSNFNNTIPPSIIMHYIIQYIKLRIPLIQKLNEITVEELTYKEFFDDNLITLFVPKGYPIIIDPFSKNDQQTFHFASILFEDKSNHVTKKIVIDELSSQNIENYISFDIKLNYLSYLILNYIKNNGNLFFIFGNDLSFSASKSICRLNDYTNFSYSDNSLNENKNLTIEYLEVDELQFETIDNCLINDDIRNIILSDTEKNYKLKILYDIYKYSDKNDINNHIKMKILRELSPNKYTTYFLNLKFYYSFSYYFVVFKIYNNIMILTNMVERLLYRQISYIMLIVFVLWVCVFIYVFIKLCLVTDRISSPIRKLIKTISLSQVNITDEMKFEQIYYPEDKDINDLFQICQKLIFGGVKNKTNIRKKNKLNVYNNISKVKTNNMAINENQIMFQRNQKYNEIFEKEEDNKNNIKNDYFKKDLYYKYKNKDFENKIKNYETKKLKSLSADKKEEYENIRNNNPEYKMFYYINKEIEDVMPYNILYKYYYEKFSKKSNKKKKK